MRTFHYTITDALGIHARPAGLLAKTAKAYADTTITVARGDSTVKASQLMKLMSLGVQQGEEVTVTADGPQEDAAIAAMQSFFTSHL